MGGLLTALGIAGGIAFSIGWMGDGEDWLAWLLIFGGGGSLSVAAIGGLIRLFI